MKNLQKRIDRFFLNNRNKGIPNLMLWIAIINAVVYVLVASDNSGILYSLLSFSREQILRGQVWRIFTFIFLEMSGRGLLFGVLWFVFYCHIGQLLKSVVGRCKFNLFYLSGILFLAIGGLTLNLPVSSSTFHISLSLAYASCNPDAMIRLFFIIPLKVRWLGIITLAINLVQFLYFSMFPYNLLPLFSLLNYFLFFGKHFPNLFPVSWRLNGKQLKRKIKKSGSRIIHFRQDKTGNTGKSGSRLSYTHKCKVCGRTDVTNPDLDFRYCSRCNGYHCYCIDHINDHIHVE